MRDRLMYGRLREINILHNYKMRFLKCIVRFLIFLWLFKRSVQHSCVLLLLQLYNFYIFDTQLNEKMKEKCASNTQYMKWTRHTFEQHFFSRCLPRFNGLLSIDKSRNWIIRCNFLLATLSNKKIQNNMIMAGRFHFVLNSFITPANNNSNAAAASDLISLQI